MLSLPEAERSISHAMVTQSFSVLDFTIAREMLRSASGKLSMTFFVYLIHSATLP